MWRAGRPELAEVVRVSGASPESSFRELDDAFLQTQARIWLGEVLHIRFDEETAVADLLADGELLFQVSKVIWKKLTKKDVELKNSKVFIHEKTSFRKSDARYMPYPKVDSFLKLCQIIGLTGIDLFSPSDVVEKRNIRKVCLCLRSLSIKARAKELKVPDFDVVTYTIVMPTIFVGGIRRYWEQARCNFLSPKEQYKKKNDSGNHDQYLESDPESDEEDGGSTETESTTLSPLPNSNAYSFKEELTSDGNGGESFDSQTEFPDHCEHGDTNVECGQGVPIQSIESSFDSIHDQDDLSATLHNKEDDIGNQQPHEGFEMRETNKSTNWRADDGYPIERGKSLEELSQISSSDSNSDDFDHGVAKKLLEDSIKLDNRDATADGILLAKIRECSTTVDSSFSSNPDESTTGVSNATTENQYVPEDLLVDVKETSSMKTNAESTLNCCMVSEDLSESFTESPSSVFGTVTLTENSASSLEETDPHTTQINLLPFNELKNSSEEWTSMLSTSDSDHSVHQQTMEGTVHRSDLSEIKFFGGRKCQLADIYTTADHQCSNDYCNIESTRENAGDDNTLPGCSTTKCIGLDEGIVSENQLEVEGQIPVLSQNSFIGMDNIITDYTQDKNKGTEKPENRTTPPSVSIDEDGELGSSNSTKSGHVVLKSIAGGATLIGAVLLFVHLRKGREKKHDNPMVVPSQDRKRFNNESPPQNRVGSHKNDAVYPGKRLQL